MGAVEYVMLALPHSGTDWNHMLDEALDQYRRLVGALTSERQKVLLLCRDSAQARDILSDCDRT